MTMIIDGTNGLTFNNGTTQASAGQVLQVVNATNNTQVASSSTTYSDTGLTATITPKFATSKILVLASQMGVAKDSTASANSVNLRLVRNGSSIVVYSIQVGYTNSSTWNIIGGQSYTYLDSPSTTLSLTYKVQMNSNAGGAFVYTNINNDVSSITLMEIAA